MHHQPAIPWRRRRLARFWQPQATDNQLPRLVLRSMCVAWRHCFLNSFVNFFFPFDRFTPWVSYTRSTFFFSGPTGTEAGSCTKPGELRGGTSGTHARLGRGGSNALLANTFLMPDCPIPKGGTPSAAQWHPPAPPTQYKLYV